MLCLVRIAVNTYNALRDSYLSIRPSRWLTSSRQVGLWGGLLFIFHRLRKPAPEQGLRILVNLNEKICMAADKKRRA